MKTMLLGAVALQCAVGASALTEHEVAFKFYKQQFNKVYSGEAEEAQRFAAFKASMTRVAASGNKAHGLTQFSDMTQAEFKQRMTARVQREETPTSTYQGECPACTRFPEVANLGKNTSWDWTQHGAVTAVKNQGQCGSCWSFGTTGDIEGTWFLAGNKLTSLSEQELVSCDKTDAGCGGGLQETAFAWVIKKGGLTGEADYPYVSGGGNVPTCKTHKESLVKAKISSWYRVSGSAAGESAIEEQLAKVGPITIGINATPMQDYTGGIDDPKNCDPQSLDHAVLIVGYGEENGTKYWKIKNSWATSWGEKGYYRIVRGQDKCGLANDAVHSRV